MSWQAWYDGWPVIKSFPGHKGRKGQRGGSVPKRGARIAFQPSSVDSAVGFRLVASSYGERKIPVKEVFRSGHSLEGALSVTESGEGFLGSEDPRSGIFTAKRPETAGFYGAISAIKRGQVKYDEDSGEWEIKGELPKVYSIDVEGNTQWEQWRMESVYNPYVGIGRGG